jgi:hypothetical protein
MYENRTMEFIEMILRRGMGMRENNRGGESN